MFESAAASTRAPVAASWCTVRVELASGAGFGLVSFGLEALSRLTLESSPRLLDHLDPDSRAKLSALAALRGGGHTAYLHTPRGRPLEVVLTSRAPDAAELVLHVRTTENALGADRGVGMYYRNFLSSKEAVVFFDLHGVVREVNRAFLDLFGCRLRDVLSQRIWEVLRFAEPIAQRAIAANTATSGETEIFGASRTVFAFVTVSPVGPAGRSVGFALRIVDRSAERERVARVRGLTELLLGLSTGEPEVSALRAALSPLGAQAVELYRRVSGGQLTPAPGSTRRLGDPGEPEEPRIVSPPEPLLAQGVGAVLVAPVRGAGGLEAVFAAFFRDAPRAEVELLELSRALADALAGEWERRRKEWQLTEIERRYRRIADELPDIVWQLDAEGRLRYGSPAFSRITGYAPAELAGHGWLRIFDYDTMVRDLARSGLTQGAGAGDPVEWLVTASRGHQAATSQRFRVENEIITKSGARRILEADLVVESGPGGRLSEIVGISRDVTEARQLMAEIERKNAELERLNQLRSSLVRAVSRDLRSPLREAFEEAQALATMGASGEGVESRLNHILRAAREMGAFIQNVLDAERIRRGGFVVAPTFVSSVRGLLEEAARGAEPSAAERGLTLTVVARPKIAARVDGPQLARAVGLLLSNAVRHAPPGSAVTIGAEARGAELVVWVEDRGPGVPVEARARVFEEHVTSLGEAQVGLGLGLHIVKAIAELHGGRADIEAPAEGGCRALIALPRSGPRGQESER